MYDWQYQLWLNDPAANELIIHDILQIMTADVTPTTLTQ